MSPAPSRAVTLVGLDADDTLWHNEHYYQLTESRFVELLSGHAHGVDIPARLLDAERRNIKLYGFGIKGFTLSMIETALDVTEGKAPGHVIRQILDAGRDLLAHPVETLPGVEATLDRLAGEYRLVLITKGDLFDQERKLAQSGLGELFHAVEIVSDKTEDTYRRIFTQHGDGPEASAMVGNSLKSDVVPAIAAGAWGIHVPHDLTWSLEHADTPEDAPRFRRAENFGEVAALIKSLG